MIRLLRIVLALCAVLSICATSANAQSLRYRIERIFDETLRLQLSGSPDAHSDHFNPANIATSEQIISGLTNFIGTNVSTFPIASATASVTFDLSTGVPVRQTGSLGPIFTERARSLGPQRTVFGYSFSHMRFSKLRGIDTSDLRFTFFHEDVGAPGMGDSDNELDTIDLFMDMEIEASILALYFSYGVTDRFDVSIGVPLVNVRVQIDPRTRINSFTFLSADSANHFFGGTTDDPVLSRSPTPVDNNAAGIGDIALQAKYVFRNEGQLRLAAIFGARLATGDAENFHGAGDAAYRIGIVGSADVGTTSPHVNLAYEVRTSDLDKDEIDLFIGLDQKVTDRFTFVMDVLAELEVGADIESLEFDETVTISRTVGTGIWTDERSTTNVPKFRNDHVINGSLGLKYAPRDFLIVIANTLFPLNDGGLRPDIMGTLGFEFNF